MRQAMILALVAGLLVTGGCGTGIREGVGLVRGAKGVHAVIDPMPDAAARPLGQYTRFELGEFTDDFGGRTPRELFRLLPGAFASQIADAELPNDASGKTLLIRGRVLHYESQDLFGMIKGDAEEVVARVELVDKASGRVLATGNCVGRTTNRVNKGVGKKADGLAKAIVTWLQSRYPEPVED
ncbi:MAG: hypothetical protein KGY99_02725 [Phycisphaerae bacterium]|nr:hypothetical protein [Phycisphaerae bacterium]